MVGSKPEFGEGRIEIIDKEKKEDIVGLVARLTQMPHSSTTTTIIIIAIERTVLLQAANS
jgi:hypothetical protein